MKLKKNIKFLGVFSIATGSMISSGIFILPGIAFAKTGPSVIISYLIAGILGLVGILSTIELSTAMPKAGGDYYFINRSLGPMIGTISGVLGWFALSLKSAFAIFGISEVIFLMTRFPPLITSAILCLAFVVMNIIGIKETVMFQIFLVIGLLSLMIVYIIFGVSKVDLSLFSPFTTKGINSIFITSGFIFISFGGLLKVASISEEVENPKKNIPLGIVTSIAVVTLLYTLTVFVLVGIMEPAKLSVSLSPVAESAKMAMGTPGFIIVSIASLLAFITTANAGIMSASRYPLALSKDKLLPSRISKVSKKFNTPTISIIFTGILIYLSLLLPLDILVKSASTIILTSYVLTNISVIIFRESKIFNYKPSFKMPLYPWVQIVCIIIFSFFIIDLGAQAIEISLAFLFLCFCLYIFYGRKNYKGEFALLHLLKRVIDGTLTENILEKELREILVSRDNLERDNFDKLVTNAKILDLEDSLEFSEFINIVSKDISKEINIPEEVVVKRFIKRQEESNTAISKFLAIPHIIIEGADKIFLMIVRCKEGIKFTEKENSVKIAFILGGSRSNRALHLKALASISTVVSQENFEKDWLGVKDENQMKDLILLSKRKRFL